MTAPAHVGMLTVFTVSLLLLSCQWQLTAAQVVQQGEVEVSTASQLSSALRDPNVWDILVTADIDMTSELASWAALPADIPVTHNLTIHGPPGQHPAIDFRYWQFNGSAPHGLALGPGVLLTFKQLTLKSVYGIAPDLIQSVTNTSRVLMDHCIAHSYVLSSPQVVFSALQPEPGEPPDSLKKLILPGGYCRVAPTPMCWDNAIVLIQHDGRYVSPHGPVAAARVDSVMRFIVAEAIISDDCATRFFKQGNDTCVFEQIGQLMARAPPGSSWVQPAPSPERVATIMAAYQSTMSAYYQSRAGASPAAAPPPPPTTTTPVQASTSSTTTGFFPVPGVYVVFGALVAVVGVAVAACWLCSSRGRAASSKEDKLCEVSVAAVGQDQAGGDHKSQGSKLEPRASARQAGSSPIDTLAITDIETAASSNSGAAPDTKMLLEQGLRPEAITVHGVDTGDVAVPDPAQQHQPFSLLEMVTLDTPFTPTLASDLKLGVDVILGSEIGHGAMGSVYAATYQGQPVAVKLFKPGTDEKAFVSELAILGRTRHPNVVRLIGTGVHGDQLALVEELADGSLEELLFPNGQGVLLPLPLVLHIAMEVASALAYLHPTIIHRDLKPGNVLLNINPAIWHQLSSPEQMNDAFVGIRAKLSDFGLSRIVNSMVHITQQPLRGTLGYMAPECFTSTSVLTHKCDVYSLGILLWELVHGTRAWQGLTQPQMVYAMVVSRLRPAITATEDRCPIALKWLIERCWQTDVDLRAPALEVVRILAVIKQQVETQQQQQQQPKA